MIAKTDFSQLSPRHSPSYGLRQPHNKDYRSLLSPPKNKNFRAQNKQILVVEDDPLILEGMAFLLSDWGYQYQTFQSEERLNDSLALTNLPSPPDLLLMDLALSGPNDGIQLAKKICATYNMTIPTLVITGSTDRESLHRLNECGFFHLHKPVIPKKLKNALSILLAE